MGDPPTIVETNGPGAFQIGTSSVTDYLEALYARAEVDQARELRLREQQTKKRRRKYQPAAELDDATPGPSRTRDTAVVEITALPAPPEDETTHRRSSRARRARPPSERGVAAADGLADRHRPSPRTKPSHLPAAVLDDSPAPTARAETRVKSENVPDSIRDPTGPCAHCLTTTTPLWHTDGAGKSLCNACGIYFKTHGSPRPPKISDQRRGPDTSPHPGFKGPPSSGPGGGASSAADHALGGRVLSSLAKTETETDLKPLLGHPESHVAHTKAVPELGGASECATKRRRLSPRPPRAVDSTSASARLSVKVPVGHDGVGAAGPGSRELRGAADAHASPHRPIKLESDASGRNDPPSAFLDIVADTKPVLAPDSPQNRSTPDADARLGLFPPPSLLRLAQPLSTSASEAASTSRQSSLTPLPEDIPAAPHCFNCLSTTSSNHSWCASKLGGSGKLCNACAHYEKKHFRRRPLSLVLRAQKKKK